MRILSYSPYDDTGGFGYLIATAFAAERRAEHRVHSVVGAPSYLSYPVHTSWSWPRITRLWREANVVHLHDGFHQTSGLPERPAVVTWHGTGFREEPEHFLRQQRQRGAVGTVSTLDLFLLAPDEVTWLPAPFDLAHLAAIRAEHRLDGEPGVDRPLRIGHFPTNRALKSTEALLAAAAKMRDVEVVMAEGRPWREILPIKATCDVYFDQTAYGYGQNSIEAWAMGIPVVCGAQDATLDEYVRRFGGLPFVLADEGNIQVALDALTYPRVRAAYGDRGRAHVERFHSQRAGVEILEPLYRSLVA